jgi:hypothetical protein
MGFGARGVAMGNAMTAVVNGDITSYYNPALSSFQDNRTFSAAYSFLALDRTLNFVNYTQNVKIFGRRYVDRGITVDTVKTVQSVAGISVGLINAGVGSIDGRDNDGFHTQDYSTSENQYFVSFSFQIIRELSVGVAFKFYHCALLQDVTSTGLGIDFGLVYKVTKNITAAAVVQDINSEYKWDTGKLYGQQGGRTTTDKYPLLKRIGVGVILPDSVGVASAEFENSNKETNIFRIGVEFYPVDIITLRAGVDRMDVSNTSNGLKPSIGFTLRKAFGDWTPAISYAFVPEPFAPSAVSVLSVSLGF